MPPAVNPSRTTFADMIAQVSDHLGDLETSTLTSVDVTTSPISLKDTARYEPDGHFTGGWLAFTGGTAANLTVERRIVNYTKGVFQCDGFPATPATGDTYELRMFPFHRRDSVKRQLNEAIRDIALAGWVYLDSRVDLADTTTYTFGLSEYAVPVDMESVYRVLFQYPANSNSSGLYYYDNMSYTGVPDTTWYPVAAYDWSTTHRGTVLITPFQHDGSATVPDTAPLTFLGVRRPQVPTVETAITEVSANYPVLYAAAQMCLRMSRGAQDADLWRDKFNLFEQLAQAARPRERTPLPSNARRVRSP